MQTNAVQVEGRQPIDLPSDLIIHLSRQSERWRDFHQDRRVLVVEDNPHTATTLHCDLEQLYGEGNVSFVNNADQALELINQAKSDDQPFDAVVLDLHMPGTSGLQLMKKLEENCPAVVINTASMTAGAVADLSIQMDKYRSYNASWLVKQHEAKQKAAGQPIVPIFLHHKNNSLQELVDKIDMAMLIKDQLDLEANAMSEFLAEFDPKLIDPDVTSEAVHDFCEELRNLRRTVLLCLKDLTENHDLEDTNWWQKNGEALQVALNDYFRTSYSSLMAETPQQTWNNVHGAVSSLLHLSPRGLKREIYTDSLNSWKDAYQEYSDRIGQIASRLRTHQEGTLAVDALLKKHCEDGGIHLETDNDRRPQYNYPAVSDKGGEIRSLLEEAVKLFRARGEIIGEQGKVSLCLNPEVELIEKTPEERALLSQHDCGSYFEIHFTDDKHEVNFEKSFASLTPLLVEHTRKGHGFWSVRCNDDYATNSLTIAVKITPKKLNFDSKRQELALRTANPTYIRQGTNIFEGLGKNSDITVIGRLPEECLYAEDSDYQTMLGLLHRHKGKIYFTAANMHCFAGDNLAYFYDHLAKQSDEADLTEHNGKKIYAEGVRVSRFSGGMPMYLEAKKGDPEKAWAVQAMLDLGVPKEILICNPEEFQPRV